jgi:hypothetical protein
LTILLGYNTPISRGLQGTAYTPYLNRRGAVSQKQAGYFSDGASGCDDIIHNGDMEAAHRYFKLKGIFQVLFTQACGEMVLGRSASVAPQSVMVPGALQPVRQRSA